ncbi:FlgO family outer membrane protein [Agaribacter flavus]|uniref:FlgO family outer membrane protein n=1 Tax=Agaribacter flavus TaxID=1902781 RepID=A0ABV7FPZ8_9ALTE
MMKRISMLAGILSLSACTSLPSLDNFWVKSNKDEQVEDTQVVDIVSEQSNQDQSLVNRADSRNVDAFGSMLKPSVMSHTPGAYKSIPLTKHVGHYVTNMANDLVANMEYVTERTPVAVTHFSLIDSDLKETNLLGQQMAESFVHEFHKFRMPVVEYKATQFIRVTETGDYLLSRDFLDLNNSTPIQYVLTGTMTKHQGGYIVNARMLGMESKVVVASAQSFIPYYIVDALMPSESSRQNEVLDGVRIIRGE